MAWRFSSGCPQLTPIKCPCITLLTFNYDMLFQPFSTCNITPAFCTEGASRTVQRQVVHVCTMSLAITACIEAFHFDCMHGARRSIRDFYGFHMSLWVSYVLCSVHNINPQPSPALASAEVWVCVPKLPALPTVQCCSLCLCTKACSRVFVRGCVQGRWRGTGSGCSSRGMGVGASKPPPPSQAKVRRDKRGTKQELKTTTPKSRSDTPPPR